MTHIRLLVLASLILLSPLPTAAQEEPEPFHPHPSPQFTGHFIGTDGARLTLQAEHNSQSVIFTGRIHSTCVVPRQSKGGEEKPLGVSAIPIGTLMTVFYVRHVDGVPIRRPPENVILGMRFDRLPSDGSKLPQGVAIPCFNAEAQPGR